MSKPVARHPDEEWPASGIGGEANMCDAHSDVDCLRPWATLATSKIWKSSQTS